MNRKSIWAAMVVAWFVQWPAAGHGATPYETLLEKAFTPLTPGKRPPFLGIFTHTDALYGFPDMVKHIQQVNEANPHIQGYAFRTQWRVYHPEKDRFDWDGLEAAIDAAASAGRLVTLGMLPGGASPDWIYEEGAMKFGPVRMGARVITTPLPWDPVFVQLYRRDLEQIAQRYGDDPRVFAIEVLGATFNYLGEEMHAPSVKSLLSIGWTPQLAVENWKHWIDQYNELFPNKKLYMVPSQMNLGAESLSLPVVEYFLKTCAGRAYMQTHQMIAKHDTLGYGPLIGQRFRDLAPMTHENARSWKFAPAEQGTPEMTVYKILRVGVPHYLQLWSRDAEEPEIAKAFLDAWNQYGSMTADECKEALIQKGLFVGDSALSMHAFGYTPYDLPRLPPEGYPGHKDPFLWEWSPFQ